MSTKIGWTHIPGTTGETWNLVTGCTPVSPGCAHCYAERMARRLAGRHGYPPVPHHFDVTLRPERLEQPLHWRKPRTAFVCSMSDLFHEDVPFRFVDQIMAVMALCSQHTFIILTKRPARVLAYFCDYPSAGDDGNIANELTSNSALLWQAARQFGGTPERYCDIVGVDERQASSDYFVELERPMAFPFQNVWLGVSAENQECADERIPLLLQTPAAVRFVSCEPLLGPIDLFDINGDIAVRMAELEPRELLYPGDVIDWVIVGGESGPGARAMNLDWLRDIRDQCTDADVPLFVKQDSGLYPGQQGRIPDELWIKEFPHQEV